MPSSSPIQILFAEDERFLRELIAKQLQARGYRVEAVQSGDEALATLLAGAAIDILLTDIDMPGTLDGWALAEHSRNLHPAIGVVYATNQQIDVSRQLTGSQFVAKPYRLETIVAAIQQLVSAHRRENSPPAARDDLARPGLSDAGPQ